MDTPQIDDVFLWLGGVAAALIAIVAVLALGRKALLGTLTRDIADMRSQLYRNGGTSLRDAVDRIEERQTDIQRDVRELRVRIDDHISWHLDREGKS